jgi:hypothetical protein
VKERIKQFFELSAPYRFDPTDLTAAIYVVCTIMCALGLNTTWLMLIGATIGAIFCWKAHRINLVVLNITLLVFNMICLFRSFP